MRILFCVKGCLSRRRTARISYSSLELWHGTPPRGSPASAPRESPPEYRPALTIPRQSTQYVKRTFDLERELEAATENQSRMVMGQPRVATISNVFQSVPNTVAVPTTEQQGELDVPVSMERTFRELQASSQISLPPVIIQASPAQIDPQPDRMQPNERETGPLPEQPHELPMGPARNPGPSPTPSAPTPSSDPARNPGPSPTPSAPPTPSGSLPTTGSMAQTGTFGASTKESLARMRRVLQKDARTCRIQRVLDS